MNTVKYILLFLTINLCASILYGSTAAVFLENGFGSRAIGMGMSQVAIAGDGYAAYWNPAGLMRLKDTEINSMMSSIFGVVDQKFLGYATKLPDNKAFSIFYTTAGVSDIAGSTYSSVTGLVTATGSDMAYEASAIYISAAGSVSRLVNYILNKNYFASDEREVYVGASIKLISERLQLRNASGLGLDFGLATKLDSKMSFGVQLQNIISPYVQWNTPEQPAMHIPMVIKAGIGYAYNEKILLALDLDIKPSEENKYLLHYGLEYEVRRSEKAGLLVRVGLDRGKLAFGLGLNYQNFSGDYAYESAQTAYMPDTHRFSLCYRLPNITTKSVESQSSTTNFVSVQSKIPDIENKIILAKPVKTEQQVSLMTEKQVVKEVVVTEQVIVSPPKPLSLDTNIFGDKKVAESSTMTKNNKPLEIVTPSIGVELPAGPIFVTKPIFGIRGKVINAKTMWINNKEVWCNANGYFYEDVPLVLFENIITFRAVSRTGHESVVVRKVYRRE